MRLLGLTKNELDPAQLALYDDITTGPRASGPQLFPLTETSGALTGPFGIMLHHPALGKPLQDLGAAIRYKTALNGRVREMAILSVAAAARSSFEQFAHERIARALGMTDAEIANLSNGFFRASDPTEAAAYQFCQVLLTEHLPLTDTEYREFADKLDNDALLELTVLVGYYRTLAQLLHVFDVGVPDPDNTE